MLYTHEMDNVQYDLTHVKPPPSTAGNGLLWGRRKKSFFFVAVAEKTKALA